MITQVVAPEELERPDIQLEGSAFHHLFRARRLSSGAEVRLVDGRGRARWGRVDLVTSTSAHLTLGGEALRNEPTCRLELVTPPPRPKRLSWLVEKATEVGVAAIRLIHSQRAPRRCGERTIERLRRVAVAAVEQSHRSVVPEISGVHQWQELTGLLEASPERWLLEPGDPAPASRPSIQRATLIVGPEGGWTEAELAALKGRRCRSLRLGPTTLRVETAAVVGSALLLWGLEGASGELH